MTMIKIINSETGEEIEREMTAAEKKQYQADVKEYAISEDLKATQKVEKAALLERLGITADEAALLLK